MLTLDSQINKQIFSDVLPVPDTKLGTATVEKMCLLGTLRTEGDDVIKRLLAISLLAS